MNFNLTYSDFKEISEYLIKNSNGGMMKIEIDVNDNNMAIEFFNKLEEKCTVKVYRATTDNSATYFPTVTKTSRLGDK
jgi:hypothetical protein